jgi:heat shock protein HslJ
MTKNYKNSRQFIQIVVFILLVLPTACTSVLYVAPKRADCTSVTDQYCYLIRNSPEGNWVMHLQEIKGLDYEPGFSYKLKVKKESVKKSQADGGIMRYAMVELMEKRDVAADIVKEDLFGKEWKLEFLKTPGTQFLPDDKVPVLRFGEDGKIGGFGGCNNYFGGFSLNGRTIKVGEIGSTKMLCEDTMDLETTYLKVLSMELRALFSDRKLILSADGGNQMIFGYQ